MLETRTRHIRAALLALGLAATSGAHAAEPDTAWLAAAIAGPQRSPAFVARDLARHPEAELAFFGLKPTMSVIEIWPGGGYWTEILAPALRQSGHYEVAVSPPKDGDISPAALEATPIGRKLASDPALYQGISLDVAGRGHPDIAPPASADLVLTFRNLHNWMAGGYAPQMFDAFFRVLKPGGTLGIEDHRGNRDTPQDPLAKDGYVREDAAIAMAEAAGFVLDGRSEIGANPRDTANWPKGVWTLPPNFALGAQDHDRYAAIGEADNFVLRFRKP
jgi:predicted methyltransferase